MADENKDIAKEKPKEEAKVSPKDASTGNVSKKNDVRERKSGNFAGRFGKKGPDPSWKPKTSLGKQVKEGVITDIDIILDEGGKIMEAGIVDLLLPELQTDLLLIGQAKGKFGGGQRRVFRQTQKKTMEGNKPKFTTYAVVGNENGYIGLGAGSAKETVPAREKAFRNAKLDIFKIRRGCGSWQCGCRTPHTIPFKVTGKCGSVVMVLKPAPKGTGLKVEKECAKILKMAGIKDVWSKAYGQTKTKVNLLLALKDAMRKLMSTKVTSKFEQELGMVEGKIIEEKMPEIESDTQDTQSE